MDRRQVSAQNGKNRFPHRYRSYSLAEYGKRRVDADRNWLITMCWAILAALAS
jgi:hypothetical protein